jgi:heme-degrading monooxygenase HmoA
MPFVAKTPKPPYYAVVFTSLNAPGIDHSEHVAMSQHLIKVAETYEGYLGIEPARNGDGSGVTAVYFKDPESIAAWARDPEHMVAKRKGRKTWISHYMLRICKVERDYGRPDWAQD